jgi:hypothetical protein
LIREPNEDELRNYITQSVALLSMTAYNASEKEPATFLAMLQDGAVGACTALEAGGDLVDAIRDGLAAIPVDQPDPMVNLRDGFSLAIQLVTTGVKTYCPQLDPASDAIDLSNAWSELTGGANQPGSGDRRRCLGGGR